METLKLFEAYGIESEYMIINSTDLKVQPIADIILAELRQKEKADTFKDGKATWSNELAAHVLEIKCSSPSPSLENLDEIFHKSLLKVLEILKKYHCCFMPTAMHPFMNPLTETKLWPYGQKQIYKKYNEIFKCTGHGWSNLQSVHINLPYANDEEFAKLHAAIRMILPLIPWLSASSPIVENHKSLYATNRLEFYRKNQIKIPSITGEIIPEPVYSEKGYQELLKKIYADLSTYDPKGILCHSWVNSRGAIPKFDDKAIEIRIMDIQESPLCDIAIVFFISCLLKNIISNDHLIEKIKYINEVKLKEILLSAMKYEDFALPQWYSSFLYNEKNKLSINELLISLFDTHKNEIPKKYYNPIETILYKGNLAKRIITKKQNIPEVYSELITCLENNSVYDPIN